MERGARFWGFFFSPTDNRGRGWGWGLKRCAPLRLRSGHAFSLWRYFLTTSFRLGFLGFMIAVCDGRFVKRRELRTYRLPTVVAFYVGTARLADLGTTRRIGK